jgi:phosphatidylethanolamine/phosphatidyl-N-methylethanolamine N-methyltransferase
METGGRLAWLPWVNDREITSRRSAILPAIRKINRKFAYIQAWKRDHHVANLCSTSHFAIRAICNKIDFSHPFHAIEFGAGTGEFARYLLKQMRPDSSLILIEKNPLLFEYLKEITDPRVTAYLDTAENLSEILKASNLEEIDYVISGIPFSRFDLETKRTILRNSHRVLKAGSKFVAYQSVNHIRKHLELYFRRVTVQLEWRNIPPLLIYEATK